MQSEFNLVHHLIQNPSEITICSNQSTTGTIGDKNIILSKCGIGKVNSAIQTAEIIEKFNPDYIINSGVAGGIGKGIKQGDIVAGDNCLYHDVWCGEGLWGQIQGLPLLFPANNHLIETIKKIDNNKIKIGLICTGDQFITEIDRLNDIKKNFPNGLAVDMESASIAHVCYLRKIPFMSIRIISDTPGMEPDNTSQYIDFFADAPKLTFAILENLIEKI